MEYFVFTYITFFRHTIQRILRKLSFSHPEMQF